MTPQTFEGVPLVLQDDEPWIVDEALAGTLGYKRPSDIRALIDRHKPFLPGIQRRRTVRRHEIRPGVFQNTPVEEYLLNESQIGRAHV